MKADTYFEVCRSVAEAADRSYAYVIVTTKAIPDIMPTPELLAPFLEPEYVEKYEQPVYVLLQNGLNVEMDLFAALKALGKAPQILGSALYINANALKPDLVEHSDFVRPSRSAYIPHRTNQSTGMDISGRLPRGPLGFGEQS